ncbi:MAG: T9SS type A sorting domain-containing protein [Ignavibacteriales bacterium]|nr:MAG: T9SS type A sorting domain-containing protein [Ignavibacteriales bacterium]
MSKLKLLLSLMLFTFLATGTLATVHNVAVNSNVFTPANIEVAVGDTIVWTLQAGSHTTTSTVVPAGATSWDYTFTGVGDTYTYIVTVEGYYNYVCTFHPGMNGFVNTARTLPFQENFAYPVGDSLGVHGWMAHSGTTPMLIVSGSLTYPNYPNSGVGNSVLVAGGSGSRVDSHIGFNTAISTGAAYTSLLVNVASPGPTTADYFFHFGPSFPTTTFRGRLFVRDDGSGGLNFGISKATSTVSYAPGTYTYGTTYLIVVKYEIVTDVTGSDDVVKIFINPTLPGGEPGSADATNTDSGTDTPVSSISLRQGGQTYNVTVDGIRAGSTWTEVTVPVELVSFKANVTGNAVQLSWVTASELNNQGFEIERKSANNSWQKIGFVQGNGTTSSTKTYSYVDGNLQAGKYSYRLKQVDFNGTYEYTNVIEAEVTPVPVKFDLAQNFPNPFNPTTTINYAIPQASNVTLKVYNMLGQEVKTLVNKFVEAGQHTVKFDAQDLNSGLYFYKLEAGSFNMVKKMTLLK